jgi:hypothetical protein
MVDLIAMFMFLCFIARSRVKVMDRGKKSSRHWPARNPSMT